MEIYSMIELWQEFLFRPMFNALIWIYNNWSDGNMGWAVVYLTIIIRMALFPFSIFEVRNQVKNEQLYDEIKAIEKGYKNDPIQMKDEIRAVLKKRKVQPWLKAVILGIQGLALLLLYQVFVKGATGERLLKNLYPSIKVPGTINTNFYGFDIVATHDIVWSLIPTLWLMAEIYLGMRKRKGGLDQGDLAYFILFPFFVFLFLYLLPMVKAIFIFTSMLFSTFTYAILRFIFRTTNKKPAGG